MNYARIYKSIVSRAKDRQVDGYTESHHVIPRCMGMGIGPFMSVHKKFKSGWIPTEDEQWKKFKEE